MAKKDESEDKKGERGLLPPGPGRPYYRVSFVDQFGVRRRERAGKSVTSARALLEKRRTEVRDLTYVPPRDRREKLHLFEDALEHYKPEMQARKGRLNKTAFRWDSLAKEWLKEFRGRSVETLEPKDIARWMNRQTHLTPATINRKLSFLRRFFTLAERDEMVSISPFKKIELPDEDNERVRYFAPAEFERLQKTDPLSDWKVWRIVLFAILTGLRRSEQFDLRRDQVFLEERVLDIVRKPGRRQRLKICRAAAAILQEILAEHDSEWVFPSSKPSSPMSGPNFVRRVFNPALAAARIKDFHWHDLRHEFATRLVRAGVDLYCVMELLGHSNIKTTQRYAHLAPAHLEHAVGVLDPAQAVAILDRPGVPGATPSEDVKISGTKLALEWRSSRTMSVTSGL